MAKKILWVYLSCLSLMSVNGLGQDYSDVKGRYIVTGYGDTTYVDRENVEGNFTTRFIPIFLFKLSDKLHVEAELEVSLTEDGEVELELEYADIHYFIGESTLLTTGKFLLPFGQFGPNLHPSWINKLPTTPAIYGHDGGGLQPLIPVMSDVGLSMQKVFLLGPSRRIFMDVYLTQGPRAEPEHAAGKLGGKLGRSSLKKNIGEEELPELEFEAGSKDNNNNKAIGARVAYAWLPGFEAGYSFYQAAYDDAAELDFIAQNLDINYIGRHWQLRAEYITTEVDRFEEVARTESNDDPTAAEDDHALEIERIKRDGWYLQASFQLSTLNISMLNSWEVVGRYSKLSKVQEGDQWTMGLNYWASNSSVVKFSYSDVQPKNGAGERVLVAQFSYGF